MAQQLLLPRGDSGVAVRDAFVAAMGAVAGSVAVVTTEGPAGRFGQTVSSFCSVSAEPPLILVCVNSRSPLCQAIEINGSFAVNVLSASQSQISDSFAGRPREGAPYDFDSISWSSDINGSPLIEGATATFSCTLEDRIQGGTHLMYLGNVLTASREEETPLVYRSRTYGHHTALT
jgi:flavin reductase (DIM6/NTAB) family NADH-FMN oxidoreductase RutF